MQSVAYTFLYIRCEALYYLNGENAWGSKLFDTPSYHGLPDSLDKFCWYIINFGRLPLFQWCYCNLNFLTEDWLQIFFRGLAAVQYSVVSTTLIVVQYWAICCPSAENLFFFIKKIIMITVLYNGCTCNRIVLPDARNISLRHVTNKASDVTLLRQ